MVAVGPAGGKRRAVGNRALCWWTTAASCSRRPTRAWQGKTEFFLYDSAEFQSDGNFELGAKVGYRRMDGSWEASLFGRNITDEENLKGGIDFNNNTGLRRRAAHDRR
ncbi:MAG: hypothetical protein U5R48_08425 [Gammaproteobacteria bacterium]|nr:hypothetical protein [Gammaproteobacteria bacterium]